MINLYVENYCHNCPEFEPDVYKGEFFCDGESYKVTKVRCKHRERCESIVEYLEKEIRKEE